ncbi:MAG TPA: tetratricopeptide repeat protein [Xanthobacteraceae bacterium]
MTKTGNEGHTSFGFVRHEYAKLLALSGRAEEACAHARRAVDIHARAFGAMHQWTQDSATVLAGALDALGRSEEALDVRRCHALVS